MMNFFLSSEMRQAYLTVTASAAEARAKGSVTGSRIGKFLFKSVQ